MSVSRLAHITPIGVEQMGDLADSLHDPAVLRLENLDTDLCPPPSALAFTKAAVDDDAANSYLPFFGLDRTRQAAAELVSRQSGQPYDWKTECLISAGGLSGILNVLLATLEPGDEVLLTDPIYVGLVNRVRLAGGVPRYVPLVPSAQGWRLDTDALAAIDPAPVRAALLMSPSMPTGAVFSREEWAALVAFCRRADCWLINDNVVCQTGIAMGAVATAITDPDDGIAPSVAEWQRRRDVVLEELAGLPAIPPHGGWSLLLDVTPFGLSGAEASRRLLERGKIAATPMVNWGGERAGRYVRFVFANEPVARLRGLGPRVRAALA